MSPWQLRQHKHSQLWVRLLTISLLVHAIVLVLLLVMYKGYATDYRIHVGVPVHQQASKVVFVPLAKSIPSKGNPARGKSGTSAVGAGKAAVPATSAKSAKPKKQTTVVAPKKAKKKPIKPAPKPVAKKKEVKKKPKPVEKKKVKKPEPVKKVVKKEPEKVVPKKAEVKKEVVEKAVTPLLTQPLQEAIASAVQETGAESAQDVVYIGQHEYDAMQMEELIRQEIENQWRPPAGLSKDLVCEIDVLVGWDGKASNVEVKQKSGVLMYDTYARSTVFAMTFPRVACGKQLCMHFKQ